MKPDARVTMLMVVVVEEHLAERSGVLDRAEVGRERGAILEGFVDRFGVRVVVALTG
jgi:hypothetical protein